MNRIGTTIIVSALAWLVACEPCSMTTACLGNASVASVGQLVDPFSGRPVVGAQVDMWVGATTNPPSAQARTAANGLFELSVAAGEGPQPTTFRVSTPGQAPYIVPGVSLRATRTVGDATVLAPWVAYRPAFAIAVIVVSGPDGNTPVPGAVVRFDRLSGARLILYGSGTVVTSASAIVDETGYSYPLEKVTTDTLGTVIGTITVVRPSTGDSVTVPAVKAAADERYQPVFVETVVRLP